MAQTRTYKTEESLLTNFCLYYDCFLPPFIRDHWDFESQKEMVQTVFPALPTLKKVYGFENDGLLERIMTLSREERLNVYLLLLFEEVKTIEEAIHIVKDGQNREKQKELELLKKALTVVEREKKVSMDELRKMLSKKTFAKMYFLSRYTGSEKEAIINFLKKEIRFIARMA